MPARGEAGTVATVSTAHAWGRAGGPLAVSRPVGSARSSQMRLRRQTAARRTVEVFCQARHHRLTRTLQVISEGRASAT